MAPLTSIQMLLIILLCLASSELGADRVHGQQLDTRGFISIDCGIAGDAAYSDDSTHGIRYIPDAGFVDAGAGLNAGISPPYNDPNMAARYLTVRYFPPGSGGRRGCYTLRPLTPGGKYLVRSSFYYGNYDGENRFPAFDLHLGGERWATVNVTAAGTAYVHEAVVVAPAPADYLQVCVVDLGLGTPFISGLDLRPLAAEMYPEADAGHSLALLSQFRPAAALGFNRYHFWPAGKPFYRYPFDRYDRIWQRFGTDFSWTNITTSDTVNTSGDVPSLVLQSAAAPAMNGSRIDISWSSSGDPSMITNNMTYLLLLYFAELQRLPGDELRQFDILVDNASWNGSRGYVPKYLSAEAVSMMVQGSGHQQQQQQHTVSLVATANATLPPILNAFEVYSVQQLTEFQTNVGDGEAFVASPLTWHQRLKIALDSAHGLEYLHKSCRPPLIHRDVKTKNILLSANLEAKISDFGLTKVFTDEFATHVTTQPAGTLGYLDPEYYNTSRLSEKSDVYSFGVVLLEIITGQPPAVPINDNESIHIAQWVRQKLSDGNIESVADPRMGGEYDINSVWKVAELALNCKEQPSRERPSMTDVVAELKESLELEVSHAMGYYSSVTTSVNNLSATSVDLQTDHAEASDARQQTVIELGQAGNDSETRIGPTPR
ncbi:hypothetical protein E2562_002315 [Oryza meyeriana var. granulata]|uniref:Protein kinase domain-containing protein n=1 Tax=Oryza meyeriana var. granulata TaxID=110450 RepID=A0A6G1BHR3_9ORYZ|nr:hypothetical protein E2562_002315 [Oryza meyeriana var. granulata]